MSAGWAAVIVTLLIAISGGVWRLSFQLATVVEKVASHDRRLTVLEQPRRVTS